MGLWVLINEAWYKTWLAIDFALAVATGGCAMGSIECEPGDVLYIDMENGHRRIQRRIDMIFPHEPARPDFSRLEWVTEAPALNNRFMDALEDWRQSVETPRLVVIDVLQRIKPAATGKQNSYESDYACFSGLQTWAMENRIAVLALHHTRKGGADDPLEALTGSNGLSAVADTTLVLDRNSSGMTLYVRGRDVEEKDTAIRFDAGLWSILGETAEVHRSSERVTLLETLLEATELMSPSVIASVTGMKSGNVRKLLISMTKAGEVQKVGYGRYIHPQNTHLTDDPRTPGNTGNTGNA